MREYGFIPIYYVPAYPYGYIAREMSLVVVSVCVYDAWKGSNRDKSSLILALGTEEDSVVMNLPDKK